MYELASCFRYKVTGLGWIRANLGKTCEYNTFVDKDVTATLGVEHLSGRTNEKSGLFEGK